MSRQKKKPCRLEKSTAMHIPCSKCPNRLLHCPFYRFPSPLLVSSRFLFDKGVSFGSPPDPIQLQCISRCTPTLDPSGSFEHVWCLKVVLLLQFVSIPPVPFFAVFARLFSGFFPHAERLRRLCQQQLCWRTKHDCTIVKIVASQFSASSINLMTQNQQIHTVPEPDRVPLVRPRSRCGWSSLKDSGRPWVVPVRAPPAVAARRIRSACDRGDSSFRMDRSFLAQQYFQLLNSFFFFPRSPLYHFLFRRLC